MSSFEPQTISSSVTQADPTKHVNYSLGMVLGVDDFTQEFAYLTGRDAWLARDLLGYGTATGLNVTLDRPSQNVFRVVVTPGAAVSPRGQLIRVQTPQCAFLNEWLALPKTAQYLNGLKTVPPNMRLYIVLSYRDCKTDKVPIPGEPCRSEDEAMAASRVADDYSLELSFNAPDQREENALRDFIQWLSQIEIAETNNQQLFISLAEFEQAIRTAAGLGLSSPPAIRDFMYGSPLSGMRVPSGRASEYLRAAFRIWVTELRPLWLGMGQTAGGQLPREEGVLLGELTVPIRKVSNVWEVNSESLADLALNQERRPFLLHLRMVQEWIKNATSHPANTVRAETSFGLQPNAGTSEAYSRADHTHGAPALGGDIGGAAGDLSVQGIRGIPVGRTVPNTDDVLRYQNGEWRPATLPPLPLAGDVTRMSNNSLIAAIQGTPVFAAPDSGLLSDGNTLTFVVDPNSSQGTWRPAPLTIQGERVRGGPAGSAANNQVLRFFAGSAGAPGEWRASNPPDLSGDVSGPVGNNRFVRLQGVNVPGADLVAPPQPGQVLTCVDVMRGATMVREWQPAPPAVPNNNMAGDVTGTTAANTVMRIRGMDIADPVTNAPVSGYVLTYIKVGTAPGSWQAKAVPVTTAVTLAGDVTGSSGSNTISKLRTYPLDFTTAPTEGQVLAFKSGKWVASAAPAVSTLAGDVTGAASATKVTGIQGFKVTDPATVLMEDGQLMTYRGGSWVFEHPRQNVMMKVGGGQYTVVASGIIRTAPNTSRFRPFNNLNASVPAAGQLLLSFNTYVMPPVDNSTFYVIEASVLYNASVFTGRGLVSPIVRLDSFRDVGIVLSVRDGATLLATDILGALEYMIEVKYVEPSKTLSGGQMGAATA